MLIGFVVSNMGVAPDNPGGNELLTDGDGEEPSIEEMMENYEKYREMCDRSLSPHDVKDYLPAGVWYDGNKLWVNTSDNPNTDAEKTSLTSKRRKIIRYLNDGYTQMEVEEKNIASQSYAYNTKKLFGFLLDNPLLYDAFVEKSLRASKDYKVKMGDSVISRDSRPQAIAAAERMATSADDVVVIEYPDGKVEEYLPDPKSPGKEDDDDEAPKSQEQERPFTEDDYREIVAALHRDENDELAERVIKQVWG